MYSRILSVAITRTPFSRWVSRHFVISLTILVAIGLFLFATPRRSQSVQLTTGTLGPSPTWHKVLESSHVAVILQEAKRDVLPSETVLPANNSQGDVITFRVAKVLKGQKLIKSGDYVRIARKDAMLVVQPPHLWLGKYFVYGDKSSYWYAQSISDTGKSYVEMLTTDMPFEKRVIDFYRFLNADDESVRYDVQQELSRLSLKQRMLLRGNIDHDATVRRARDQKANLVDRRLAFQFVAVAGTKVDGNWLRDLIEHTPEADHQIVYESAVVEAYLALSGEAGLNWLERNVLNEPGSIWEGAAIDALVEHWRAQQFLSRDRVGTVLHRMLQWPEPSDSLIWHLAELKDWSQIERVAKIGTESADAIRKKGGAKEARGDGFSLRFNAAVGYLDTCPLPAAKAHLKKLKDSGATDP